MDKKIILLSGSPNVGKSSIFNILTGMHQHTGNWSGKTVQTSEGLCKKNKQYKFIDLPGTYSLMHLSDEELVARDAIAFTNCYKNIIVSDACSLERNLNLIFQILEVNKNTILCLNQCDLAKKKNINIDVKKLKELLGIEVVLCSAKNKIGIDELVNSIESNKLSTFELNYSSLEDDILELSSMLDDFGLNINTRFVSLRLLEGDKSIVKSIKDRFDVNILNDKINAFLRNQNFDNNMDKICFELNRKASEIYKSVVSINKKHKDYTLLFDKLITKKRFGIPFSCLMLSLIFYITIVLANYPSSLLSSMFNFFGDKLLYLCENLNIPMFIYDPLINGIYKTLTWVISVMLPPMAIFFPLFALGEESGILPRIAFNFDRVFKKCCAHGKQALTMAMGFGCNACAIIGARIIDSPRDKLIAILTNNFIPCNGRFPLLIAIITMFFVGSSASGFTSAFLLTLLIVLSIIVSLLISKLLSLTILKGVPSHFTLELPTYKKPKVASVIVRSIFDKTLFVLARAIKVAMPAGLLIWLLANISIGGSSILNHVSNFLDPFAKLLGLDGIILFAFLLALPANEIVLPIIIMGYLSTGQMMEMSDLTSLKELLVNNGWTFMTALSVCLFSLMHFPCATSLLTIKKEVGTKWMIYAFLIPTITGMLFLFIINSIYTLLT